MNGSQHILIVDDEPAIRELIKDVLEDEGYQVSLAANAAEARRRAKDKKLSLALLDVWMPEEDGISLLHSWVKQKSVSFPVLIMSGHGTVETAVEATRLGAEGFIEKPLNTAKILQAVNRALKNDKREEELAKNRYVFMFAGNSEIMRALREQIGALSGALPKALAISGEAGSGQAALAHYLHSISAHAANPFHAAPASELGSSQALRHALEAAAAGTLFIDGLEEGAAAFYAALAKSLRQTPAALVILGAHYPFAELENGPAGEILNAIPQAARLWLPPLHERPADALDIVEACLDYHVRQDRMPYRKFPTAVKNHLLSHHRLNNVESLDALIKQMLLNGQGDVGLDEVKAALSQGAAGSQAWFQRLLKKPMREARREFERAYLENLLDELDGNVSLMAEKSGLEKNASVP